MLRGVGRKIYGIDSSFPLSEYVDPNECLKSLVVVLPRSFGSGRQPEVLIATSFLGTEYIEELFSKNA